MHPSVYCAKLLQEIVKGLPENLKSSDLAFRLEPLPSFYKEFSPKDTGLEHMFVLLLDGNTITPANPTQVDGVPNYFHIALPVYVMAEKHAVEYNYDPLTPFLKDLVATLNTLP